MNNLSILLYASDTVYRMTDLCWFLLIMGWAVYLVHKTVVKIWAADIWLGDDADVKERKLSIRKTSILPNKGWIIGSIIFAFFLTSIPSKDTLYMIAASEAGEVVINSEEGKKIMSDVKEIIDIQLEKLKAQGN